MKLIVRNDWEYLTYYLGEKKPDGTGEVKLDEKRNGIARVRWPDGTSSEVPYRSVRRRTTYGDMGHTYDAAYFDLIATVDHHGQLLQTPLTGLDIEGIGEE